MKKLFYFIIFISLVIGFTIMSLNLFKPYITAMLTLTQSVFLKFVLILSVPLILFGVIFMVATIIPGVVNLYRFKSLSFPYRWLFVFVKNNHYRVYLLRTGSGFFMIRWWTIAWLLEGKENIQKIKSYLFQEHISVAILMAGMYGLLSLWVGNSWELWIIFILHFMFYLLLSFYPANQGMGDYYLLNHLEAYLPLFQTLFNLQWAEVIRENDSTNDYLTNNVLWLYKYPNEITEERIELLDIQLQGVEFGKYLQPNVPFKKIIQFNQYRAVLYLMSVVAIQTHSDLMKSYVISWIDRVYNEDTTGVQNKDCLRLLNAVKCESFTDFDTSKLEWISSFALVGPSAILYQDLMKLVKSNV